MIEEFSTALYMITKPLVGLMLRNGVAFGDFVNLSKHAYVEEIEKELLAAGQKATTSRIAVVTGLTRKDVASLRKQKTPNLKHSGQYNRATRVISAWVGDAEFCDENGMRKVLDVQGEHGSFEVLANRYSGDVPYRAVLDELLRTKVVAFTETGKITLVQAANIPSDDETEKYTLLGEDVSLLISTIKHNITTDDTELRYQRKVCYDNIPLKYFKAFQKLASKENQKLLIKLNKWLAKHDMDKLQDQTQNQRLKTGKVGVGVFYFEEPATYQKDK